jgi:hypothetical protein
VVSRSGIRFACPFADLSGGPFADLSGGPFAGLSWEPCAACPAGDGTTCGVGWWMPLPLVCR